MDLPFPDITEDDLEFLELNTFDFDSTGGDQLWRPRRLAFMFNTVASACNGSPDLTVSTWLRLVEGEEREDIMGLWVDCDEELPWGPLEWGPLQAHWKAAQDALRARWSRVSAAGYELKLTEKAERIRAVEDPCLRAAAISWLILTSRAMEEADAEQGLRKRTVFRLEELIRIWWSLSRHLTPSSMPTMPQSALDDFVETMNAAGHTCHRALDAHICCWLPFIGWLEGISDFTAVTLGSLECKGCARSLSSHDVAEYNEANATLRANVNHPLQHGSVWPAFLVAVLSDGQIDPLSSYYSFARQHLFELLECVIAMMSIRISAPAWETLDVVLRQSLIVDQPDPAFLEWVNQYPSSWRSSLTLLSRREWQAIHDMREKYSQNPTAPSDRSRLQLLQKIYFPASAGLLEVGWDNTDVAGGSVDAFDVQVAISSVLWLATDYKFSKNVFGLFPGWLRMVHDWTEACDAVGRVFFNLPDRGSVQSIALLLQFMEQRGHLCCTIEDGRVREMYGCVIGFLSRVTEVEISMLGDLPLSGTPEPQSVSLVESLLEPSRCPCLCTKPDSARKLSLHVGDTLCMKIRALHVRMEYANSIQDILSALNTGTELGTVLTDYIQVTVESISSTLSDRVVRMWGITLYLLFQTHVLEHRPDNVLDDMKNFLNACRDRLMDRALYGLESPTTSPIEFMELLQNLLDDSKDYHDVLVPSRRKFYVLSLPFREGLHRLLLKLAEETSFLPRSLFLYDVQLLKKVAVDWGGFAEIYQGSYKDKLVALKHCRVSNEAQKRALQSLFGRETLVWRQLRHPHMLPFLGIDSTTFGPQMCLVSPWMENGNATKYRKARTFTTSDIHSLLDEISSGLFYLHSENIVHGDLCGRNILIDDEGHARLADFGLSVLAEATRGAYSSSTPSGSTRWQSPELLDFDLPKFRKTTYSDVWAFGCVCLEICTGRMPFPQIPPNREVMVAVHILSGARPVRPDDEDVIGLTDNLWHLMQKCWETVPTDRIPWQELPQRMTSIRGMP